MVPNGWTNYFERATGVTKANAQSDNFNRDVILSTDDATHCAANTIRATWNTDKFEYTAPSPAGNLCDELSMDATKQAKGDKTFAI